MIKKTVLALCLILPSLTQAGNVIQPTLQFGYDWGGKTLATVYHPNETTKIRAGSGIDLEMGATIGDDNGAFEMQFLVGYKIDSDTADNGEVTWDVVPFTAIGILKSNRWRFGGGVTYHLNPHISGSFSGYDNGVYFNDNINDRYENALGGVAQIQYQMTDNWRVGLKGTLIEYKLKNDPSVTANGNNIGINFSYNFGSSNSGFR